MSTQGLEGEPSEADACQIFMDVAMEKAAERCGTDEAIKAAMASLLGVPKDRNPSDCEEIMDVGLTETVIEQPLELRRWVLCRAWNILDQTDQTFQSSVQQAWDEARSQAQSLGVEI